MNDSSSDTCTTLAEPPPPRVPMGPPPVVLDGERAVPLRALADVALARRPLVLGDGARRRMERARTLLERFVSERRRIYGVTTGYGPLATEHVSPDVGEVLQRNLVYHLSAGVGPLLSPEHTRAVMAARAVNLSRGHSAVRVEAVETLLALLAADVLPCIPSMGTVGASGDLTPLAHMTLALIGEGRVRRGDETLDAADALAALGIEPLTLTAKDGLAFVNGTSAMAGIGAVNGAQALRLLALSLRLTVLYAELLGGRAEAYDAALGAVRPHPGQRRVHEHLATLIDGSGRLVPAPATPPVLEETGADGVRHAQPILQDPYTIRCAPQIFGAVLDVVDFHNRIVETELNAVTDNPVFLPDEERVVHGGNFYGQHVAFASDALANALVKLAVYAERRIARITDAALNGGLPPFLQGHRTGLHSGFMGAQVTATAVTAEMRTLCTPASIQSIPTNANNQDVVSMGTIGARRVAQLAEHLQHVLAVESLVLAQGFDLASARTDAPFAPASRRLVDWVRERSAFLVEDRPLAPDIARVAADLPHARWLDDGIDALEMREARC